MSRPNVSRLIFGAARLSPTLTAFLFHAAGRAMPSHWTVDYIRRELGIRVKLSARLGNGMKMQVFASEPLGDAIRKSGYYEPETVEIIKSIVKPGRVFLDIGANVGQYTLVAAALGAPVQAFEPDPSVFKVLRHNVMRNKLSNVTCHAIALAGRQGTATFHEAVPENIGAGSLCHQPQSSGRMFTVATDTLDNCAAHLDVGAIKIDVEGAELQVLSAGNQVLNKRPVLVIEFADELQHAFGFSNAQLADFLHARGYMLQRITKDGLIHYQPRHPEDSFFNVLATATTA